ncbi:MAG: hypothetical protein U9R01_08615, partial [candidate division WOR-3 bacterium]|nr:hypothetical protein [candidate division WOR-3 bacterium]
TGKSISKSSARRIVQLSNRSPYHIQLLCFHLWLVSGKKIDKIQIDKALDEVLSAQNELYYSWYDSLSLYQKAVLLALSQEREIFSQDAILTYGLKNPSTTQASVKALLRNNLIIKTKEGYEIFDPFFKLWLMKR